MSVLNDVHFTPYTVAPSPSQFTFRDLLQLNDKARSFNSRLSIIGHVDLNAFFAQVEQVRLNLSIDDPVVCVQWQAVIAVNYAARKYGIKRMDSIETCKKKCPKLVLAHAAVYEKGSVSWKYLDKLPFQGLCKVSLDPYRRESRKIFRILSTNCDLIEKASVDEGYMDFGRLVYQRLIRMFPDLKNGNPDDTLPPIPDHFDLQFKGQVYGATEEKPVVLKDWDDVITLIGSNIMFDIRKQIHAKLEYTTSGGVSRNKNIAKLAGGFLKPDNQTIILNSQVEPFLETFELTDINGMGGKTGEAVLSTYQVPGDENSIRFLKEFSQQQLTNEQYPNLYEIVHGNFSQPLRDRVDIKSMMSRKQMMNMHPVKTMYDAIDWIKTFSGDLCNRLEDLDEEQGVLTRPKTVSVSAMINWNTSSRQCSIPVFKELDKLKEQLIKYSVTLLIEILQSSYDLSKLNKTLDLKNINSNNKVNIPAIMNFAVIVTGLTKLDNSIDLFTKKDNSEQRQDKQFINKMFEKYEQEKKHIVPESAPKPEKKLDKQYISKLFEDYSKSSDNKAAILQPKKKQKLSPPPIPTKVPKPKYNIIDSLKKSKSPPPNVADAISNNFCKICQKPIENSQEHKDYHFALELSKTFQ